VRIKKDELRDVRRNLVGRNSYLIAWLRKYKRGNKYPAAGGVMTIINYHIEIPLKSSLVTHFINKIADKCSIFSSYSDFISFSQVQGATLVFHHNPFDSLQSWMSTSRKWLRRVWLHIPAQHMRTPGTNSTPSWSWLDFRGSRTQVGRGI